MLLLENCEASRSAHTRTVHVLLPLVLDFFHALLPEGRSYLSLLPKDKALDRVPLPLEPDPSLALLHEERSNRVLLPKDMVLNYTPLRLEPDPSLALLPERRSFREILPKDKSLPNTLTADSIVLTYWINSKREKPLEIASSLHVSLLQFESYCCWRISPRSLNEMSTNSAQFYYRSAYSLLTCYQRQTTKFLPLHIHKRITSFCLVRKQPSSLRRRRRRACKTRRQCYSGPAEYGCAQLLCVRSLIASSTPT